MAKFELNPEHETQGLLDSPMNFGFAFVSHFVPATAGSLRSLEGESALPPPQSHAAFGF